MAPMDRAELIEILTRRLEQRDDVAAAWLYGSWARGTERASSDVDVGVLHAGEPPDGLEGYLFELQDDLQRDVRRPVQLVVLDRASADLVHRVLRDGILLVEHDRSKRVRFTVRKQHEYFDLEPLRRLYRRLGPRQEAQA